MYAGIVTGAKGQDGSYLCELLEEKGYRVVKFIGDITNYHEIYESIKQCVDFEKIEVYNLAAKIHYDSPPKTFHVNTTGILNIIEAVKSIGIQSKCRIFQASSSEIFANTKSTWSTPQTIHTMRGPRGIYGISKESADSLVKYYRDKEEIFVCSGILYNHESPRRPGTYVTQKIIRGLQSGECFQIGNLESRRDWGHAKDYVIGMWLMLQQKSPEDYVLCTGEEHTVKEFAKLAFKEVGLDYRKYIKIDKDLKRPAEVDTLIGSYSKAKKKLGWKPTINFKQLVRDMVLSDLEFVKREKY